MRGDLRGQLAVADFEIVQNPESADGTARHFLPHWPQPGLVPRDESRGNRIENLAFKGIEENLAEEFRDASWARCLAEYGVRWRCDAAPWRGGNVDRQSLRWPDFSDVDLVLAVRPSQAATRRKPATKLYNAWHAGVPALLGNEPAFRAIRRSELDYLEISSAAEALTAVTHLQREPALYRAMIRNGRERAVDWTIDSIARQWRPLLEQKIPEQAQRDRNLKTGSAAPSRRMKRRIEQLRAFLLRAPRLEVVKSNLDS